MGDQISLVDSIMKLSFVAPYLDDTLAMTLYTICVIPLMELQAVCWYFLAKLLWKLTNSDIIFFLMSLCNSFGTGKSFSEALILASTNPQYDKSLSIELPVQYMKIPSSEHVVYRVFKLDMREKTTFFSHQKCTFKS